jgi:hypothetical protein
MVVSPIGEAVNETLVNGDTPTMFAHSDRAI